MATRVAQKRLTKEYKALQENPTQYIEAHPSEENILEWYYVITGPPDTPYAGGQYMGTLMFPAEYPFKPPAIRMITPSGRFEPNTRLCLSISDYHPKTWNPAWSVSTILVGLLSFMNGNELTSGSISCTDYERRRLAAVSHDWNARNQKFREHFPHLIKQSDAPFEDMDAKLKAAINKPSVDDAKLPTKWIWIAAAVLAGGFIIKEIL